MRLGILYLIAIGGAAIVELLAPDAPFVHATWWILLLAALVIFAALRIVRRGAGLASMRRRIAILLLLGSGIVAGFAAFTNALFAPEPRSIVAAPGSHVALPEAGATLLFPNLDSANPHVELGRGNAQTPILCRHALYSGALLLRCHQRTVVELSVRSIRGSHLTITQPTGSTFLSPILLMQQRQQIAGLDLPFDSFAVPAMHRLVKAVLFSADEAAQLRGGSATPTLLFAVNDDLNHPLSHGIGLAPVGVTTRVADLVFLARITNFPAIVVLSIPSLPTLGLALLLAVGAMLLYFFGPRSGDDRTEIR